FWTLPGLIDMLARANADGTEPATLLDSEQLNNPNGIALDLQNGHVYIADGGAGDQILRVNLDGSDLQVIVANAGDNPADIALDLANGQIYWTIPGVVDQVRRADLDGSNIETVLDAAVLSNPNGIALDVANRHIYIADGGAGDRILRFNFDGPEALVIVPDAGDNPADIALDLANGQIYWTAPGITDQVRRANLDGSNIETILDTSLLENPNGLALDVEAGQLYVADGGAGDRILRANLDGSNPEVLPIAAGDNPTGLAIAIANPLQPPDPIQVSVFAEPDTPLSEAEQTPGAFIFRLSAPAPAGGLVIGFQAADTDPDPDSRDVTIGDPGTTNIDDFTIRPIPGFTSTVTVSEGATEARLVVTLFLDDLAEDTEVISLSLLPAANYTIDTANATAELTLVETFPMTTQTVTVSIENLSPENGAFLTPLWFGFHDGTFDTYDRGRPVSPGLESLAEDGATELISQEFDLAGFGTVQGTILGGEGTPGPIDPGETASFTVELDPSDLTSRFFNYASMVIPSNDFFIANGNERAHAIFDEAGNFIGADFIVTGSNVLDAGSEVNDEIPANTAFFGQMAPNTGVSENGVVKLAEGFIPDGPILSDPRFSNADFTAEDFQVARIRVFLGEPVPPVSLNSLLSGSQERPLFNGTAATGVSSLSLNEAGDALSYSLTLSGLDFGALLGTDPTTPDPGDDVTRIHIHNGARGENGPVAFGLFDLVAPEDGGQDADDLIVTENADGSVTLSGIWDDTDPALIGLSEFVDDIRSTDPGADLDLYWNVHTEQFPGGEIRGQLQQGEAPTAGPVRLTVAVENLAPDQGAIVTPLWFGLHDGSFNTFDPSASASPAIEIVAEEGFIGLEGLTPELPSFEGTGFEGIDLTALPILPLTISSQFANSPAGERGLQGIIAPDGSPLGIFPGQEGNRSLTVFDLSSSRFLSYGAMVFPSNDAFIGDESPIELFDEVGNFIGANFTILGNQVWDAGTEVNDELFESLPFSAAGVLQGTPEGGTVQLHPGLLPAGEGGIVDFPGFANADFSAPGYEVARIQVFAEHLTPLEGSGGQNIFDIALNNTFTIESFGGVGLGAEPNAGLVDEIDTIRFEGEGLIAENLLLTQEGSDLRLSFEGVPGTSAILRDFALENFDNLPGGEGNILFDGDTEIVDSFDVFNADSIQTRVFNRNTVTFLNDLDNTVQGFADSDDVINGQGGDDEILGLSGDDLLRGGAGDDILDGGLGSDVKTGGPGADTFRFGADLIASGGGDADVITDFEASDRIDFSGFLGAGGEFSLAVLGDRLIANLTTGDTVTVLGDLTAASAQLAPLATAVAIA
ncbi:hypothetical protein C8B47_23325, partial [filamentous cyanobacterium CCP4]